MKKVPDTILPEDIFSLVGKFVRVIKSDNSPSFGYLRKIEAEFLTIERLDGEPEIISNNIVSITPTKPKYGRRGR